MDLSLVIPVKEESENLPELFKEIVAAIEPTGFTFEVIVIDDVPLPVQLRKGCRTCLRFF